MEHRSIKQIADDDWGAVRAKLLHQRRHLNCAPSPMIDGPKCRGTERYSSAKQAEQWTAYSTVASLA